MKVYGGAVQIANGYFEVEYTEYREDGSIYQKGTEDFSRERMRMLKWYLIYVPTGQLNKGGHKTWVSVGKVHVHSHKDAVFFAERVLQLVQYSIRLV